MILDPPAEARGVLFVPSPEWRDRLLADGPCGSRAPQAVRSHDRHGVPEEPPIWYEQGNPDLGLWPPVYPHALIFVWGGQPLPDGLGRLARQIPQATEEGPAIRWTVALALYRARTLIEVWHTLQRLARYEAGAAFGRALLVDAGGREISR